ncbi:hypothetical protein FORC76_2943 [Vibrio cholerae]|nr:hypothetical protein FORC76_2943 [Vibrio cholerae]
MFNPSYLKLQRCWLGSFTPIILFIYAHGDELTCCLPATPSRLGIYKGESYALNL